MLTKKALTALATLAKLKVEDVEKAIADEKEVELAIPEGLTVLTTEELETRDTNSKNDGIKAGKELGYKEIKKAAGLPEDAPSKDPAKVAEAIANKAVTDAKVTPDKQVEELKKQTELLKADLATKDNEVKTLQGKTAEIGTDRKILAAMPKNRTSLFSDDILLLALKNDGVIEEVDGKLVAKKDGEIIRDPGTKTPLPLDKALLTVFTERNWLDKPAADGGRGGHDSDKVPAFTKKSEVIAHYEKMGKNMNGADGAEITSKLAELKKADDSFDMNN